MNVAHRNQCGIKPIRVRGFNYCLFIFYECHLKYSRRTLRYVCCSEEIQILVDVPRRSYPRKLEMARDYRSHLQLKHIKCAGRPCLRKREKIAGFLKPQALTASGLYWPLPNSIINKETWYSRDFTCFKYYILNNPFLFNSAIYTVLVYASL